MKTARALLQNMRPRQWTKNGFVFAGIIFDQKLLEFDSFIRVFTAFILLCMTASTIYLINDLVDIEKDRQHPKKRNRPLASGRLPIKVAIVTAVVLPVIAVAVAAAYSLPLAAVLVAYLVLHVAYSYWLKNMVILDVFAIAAGFVLRLIAGVVVIEITNFSPWLYVVTGLLSLFLAVGKRRQELVMMGEKAVKTREIFKEYTLRLLDDMLMLTLTSVALSYTLYAIESESTYIGRVEYRLLTVPMVYYGLFRYMYVIHVKGHGGDPTDLIFEDRPLQIAFLSGVILLLVFLYVV